MRTHTLTQTDLIEIDIIRDCMDRALTHEVRGYPPGAWEANDPRWVRTPCNNKEVFACIEHVRLTGNYIGHTFEATVMSLMLTRHGQPGWRGDANKQPNFTDLPTKGA